MVPAKGITRPLLWECEYLPRNRFADPEIKDPRVSIWTSVNPGQKWRSDKKKVHFVRSIYIDLLSFHKVVEIFNTSNCFGKF